MANIQTVTKIDSSKNGKPRVYFGGRHNWQDAHYLGNKCALPQQGATVDADVSSKDFNSDGKITWFLNSWKAASNGAPQQIPGPTAQNIAAPQQMQTVPYKAPAGWDIPTGDLSRFVSNVVGSAIAAGLIKTPNDIASWSAAAYRAGNDLRSGKVKDFDDVLASMKELEEADPLESQTYGDQDDPDGVPF